MFLLEDGTRAGNSQPLDKPRRADILIGVLSSAAVIFYVILSLLSAHRGATNSVAGTQSAQQGPAAVGSVISSTR
jgi:hypothetical protein